MNDTLSIAEKWISWAPRLRSVLRIVAALMFIQNGTMKLFAFPVGMPPNGATAPLLSETGIGGILETFGGLLMLLGLFTRPVAFVLSGEMAVAYFQFHWKLAFGNWMWLPGVNQGEPAVIYCFLFLTIAFSGAGRFSFDHKVRHVT